MAVSAKLTYESLCRSGAGALDRLMAGGERPALEELDGWEFRGFNTNPGAELIRVRKFKKGFYADPARRELLQGYNVRIEQNGLLNPWVEVLRHGEPIREFYFEAGSASHAERHPNGLLLNYAIPGKLPVDPSRFLKDYLVLPYADNRDLLLGRAYYVVGPMWLPISHLVLERYNKAL